MTSYAVTTTDAKGRPAYFYLEHPNQTIHYEIFRSGSGLSLNDTFHRIDGASEILAWAKNEDLRVHNAGQFIRAFDLEEYTPTAQVRDYAFHTLPTFGDPAKDLLLCQTVVDRMKRTPDQPYQHVLAHAQSVYAGMERAGLMLNFSQVEPKWSWESYSGRSKCSGFNVQGWSENDVIRQPSVPYNCVMIHFDWICADFRVAALYSADPALNQAFVDSDPYTFLSRRLSGSDSELRDEAKLLLLKTINSLDYSDEVVRGEFPHLCQWVENTLGQIRRDNHSSNIVGRKFVIEQGRSERSIFNAILQGSVAAAMQNVLWQVRNKYPTYLVCDVHDGLVLAVPNDPLIIKQILESVGEIFLRPFRDVFTTDLVFPYRVSIGKYWKQWQEFTVVRSSQS